MDANGQIMADSRFIHLPILAVAQRLASGKGNETPAKQGQVTFRLVNSWTYTSGVYTQVVVFTLTAP